MTAVNEIESTSVELKRIAKELEEKSHEVLNDARKKGADRTKVVANASFEQKLSIENKELSLANSIESQKIGILVHKDQKKGSTSLNNTYLPSLRSCLDDALALAAFSVEDPYLTMPDRMMAPKAHSLDFLYDRELAEKSLKDLPEFAQALLAILTKDHRVALDKCEIGINVSWHGLFNSLGVTQQEMQTSISWSFFGMAVDGEEVSGFDYDGRSNYSWYGALDLALKDARAFADKVVSNLKPRKCPSYNGLVLFSPRAVEEILLGTIFYHASGSNVMDKKSKWETSIGKQVISDQITLKDSPHSPNFMGATAFDGDGLPTKDQTYIERGILQMHLHDCYSAKKTGKTSTATNGGPFALTMGTGSSSIKELRESRDEILLVDRFSGNIDPVKGDFSGVAKSSRLLFKGDDAGAVTETMIAGNLFEVLNSIQSISNQSELISGSVLLPWVLCDRVSVTGS